MKYGNYTLSIRILMKLADVSDGCEEGVKVAKY